ncbi:MAG: adenylate/guanylate cyclase domain-containing protein, partial [Acidobacteriota bacterium]|nr:adenylate/guanylate cyclase domain-containing protein [Acidobacteriota bacterium]
MTSPEGVQPCPAGGAPDAGSVAGSDAGRDPGDGSGAGPGDGSDGGSGSGDGPGSGRGEGAKGAGSAPRADALRRAERVAESLSRINRHPGLVGATRAARRRLPGDGHADPLWTAGARPREVAARYLTEMTGESPGMLGELGLTTLQLWQALSESRGRGRGEREIAVLFTDLAGFSTWALDAGDDQALRLLRAVSAASEPPIARRGGRVVKRLGDGLMATFGYAADAVEAALEAGERVAEIDVAGYHPVMRAGVHLGRPRRLGGDYFGVDVN